MKNNQPIEKRFTSYDEEVHVHSIFRTIQGEGPFCGTPCVFVRLAGCNLQCPACDTDYTSIRERLSVYQVIMRIGVLLPPGRRGLVVITGGEPFRQFIGELINKLIAHGHYVQIESNGTLDPPAAPWSWDIAAKQGAYLVISPKTPRLNSSALELACALKYVLAYDSVDGNDGLPVSALGMPNPPARPPVGWNRPIYVQPLDSKDALENRRHRDAAVSFCQQYGYTLQLQIHKIIGVE